MRRFDSESMRRLSENLDDGLSRVGDMQGNVYVSGAYSDSDPSILVLNVINRLASRIFNANYAIELLTRAVLQDEASSHVLNVQSLLRKLSMLGQLQMLHTSFRTISPHT